jgi:ABC-type bacteriocin/lantibiotic exporter with double-glycine peptidase domain
MNLKTEIRWFIAQMRPLLRPHLLSVFFTVLSSAMFLLDPLIIKWMIDVVFPRKDVRLLTLGGIAFFGIYVCRLSFSSIGGLINFATVQRLVFRMRLNLLKHINGLSAEFHESTPVGEKLYRIERDVDQVTDIGSDFVPYVLKMTFNTVFVLATMLVLNFRLTCMVLPLMPVFLVLKKRFRDKLREASDIAQQKSSRESSFLQEHLASLVQVQLLHREKTQTRSFVRFSSQRVRALKGRKFTEIAFSVSCMMVIVLGTMAILSYGGYEVFTGALTIGGFVAFYSYLGRLFDPMNAAVEIYARLNRVSTSIRRIFEITERAPTVAEHLRPVCLPVRLRGTVEMKGVSFRYSGGSLVLHGLDLNIREGEKIALVGASGSGKSTIARLIARLYDADHGNVWIDGIDVRQIKLSSLRTRVCYLPQEAILFDRSFKENLLLGNPEATDEELREAVRIALLTDVVSTLPDAWNTALGPRGGKLSGGEKQRLAVARAILQEPQLIILDESTSAVDVPAERLIFQNLRHHFSQHTMLFISHRVSALHWVDRIVVLDQGVIQEQGTHEQLMRSPGLYKALHGKPEAPIAVQPHQSQPLRA